MPTGYTAGLYEGEQSFEDFVWRVARGMGVLITMRDAPQDAPIPDHFEPSDYHEKALAEAKATLRRLSTLSEADAEAEAIAHYEEVVERQREAEERTAALRQRYEDMLERVQAWEPPTADHVGLKDYMIEQLTQSIEFDCGGRGFDPPRRRTAQEWVEEQQAGAEYDVTYHAAEHAKEVERAEGRTAWVQALRDGLAVKA